MAEAAQPRQKKKTNKTAEKDLFEALLSLKDTDECRRFFYDLCTPKEISDMAERWWVARILSEGKLSYRAIHQRTGVSVTTIGRVARFLEHENFQGYQMIIARQKNKAQDS